MFRLSSRVYTIVRLVCFPALVSMSGCVAMPEAIRTEGMVAWNYTSLIEAGAESSTKSTCLPSIRVNDFESEIPDFDESVGWAFLSMIPVVGWLTPATWTSKNWPADFWNGAGAFPAGELKPDELERILVAEISRSGISPDVTYLGSEKAVSIDGRVNFHFEIYTHLSGLGVVCTFPAPMATFVYSCIAHFDVLDRGGGEILSKDYCVESTWFAWGGIWASIAIARSYRAPGLELYPKLVQELVGDLRSLSVGTLENPEIMLAK